VIVVLLGPVESQDDRVPFLSPFGTALGRWRGTAPHPAGAEVSVELDSSEEVDWQEIEAIGPTAPLINDLDGVVEVRGPVSDYNEDDVLTLSFGGSEIRLATTGEAPTFYPTAVRLTLPAIDLYPTGI
jgi:hypothetical protein